MRRKPEKAINELLIQAEVVAGQATLGSYPEASYAELVKAAETASKFIPLAIDLPRFVISQFDGLHAQGHFEIALRDEWGQDIRRWPELG